SGRSPTRCRCTPGPWSSTANCATPAWTPCTPASTNLPCAKTGTSCHQIPGYPGLTRPPSRPAPSPLTSLHPQGTEHTPQPDWRPAVAGLPCAGGPAGGGRLIGLVGSTQPRGGAPP